MLLSVPSAIGTKNSYIYLIEHFVVGLAFSILTAKTIRKPLLSSEEIKLHNISSIIQLFFYLIFIIKGIIMAGIDVAKRVLRKDMLISPGIVEVHTPLKDDLPITINANSITLTPGTITMDVEKVEDGSIFHVHCISQEAVKNISEGGGFVDRILNIY